MNRDHDLYPRRAHGRVIAALSDTRVVILNGARQTGKSTLARLVAQGQAGTEIRYLDDAATRAAAHADPAAFVRHDGLLIIDEVQRVPDLILAIKHTVDLDPRPGRFLLTGSARLFALQQIPDLLPGRSETIELWPLSQGEINRGPERFIDAVFEFGPDLAARPSTLHRSDYLQRALAGGYPEAVRRADLGRRARFFESAVSDLLSRDVRQLSDIGRPADMRRLLNAIAAQMASLIVPGTLAGRLQIPTNTLKRYLDLLELLYVVHRVPAWSTNLTTRAIATQKMIVTDSGLAGHLAGLTMKRATRPTAPVGPIVENFVLSELARQLSWTAEPVRLHHYRDRDGYEVDAVLEHASGDVVAIEVKAAETVRGEDFRGIRHLARRLGDQLIAGIILYAGVQPLPFGDRLRALPISTLWTA
ncbi:MAG: ATP-binding protein [Pseudonocardiaceae bacterium]